MIGGGITIISVVLLFSCEWLNTSPGSFLCLPFLFVSPMFPFVDLFDTNLYLRSLPGISLPILSFIVWFLLGALIGTIVNLIKKKKSSSQADELYGSKN